MIGHGIDIKIPKMKNDEIEINFKKGGRYIGPKHTLTRQLNKSNDVCVCVGQKMKNN